MPDPVVRIGTLRWPVIVGRRRQNFDPIGTGVSVFEDWVQVETVHAEVMPAGGLTFYMSGAMEQVDTPVTHRITTRWLGYLDNTFVIIRNTTLAPTVLTLRGPVDDTGISIGVPGMTPGPGGATVRGELFRIRRVKELNGRKRFTSLDCELEKTSFAAMAAVGSP